MFLSVRTNIINVSDQKLSQLVTESGSASLQKLKQFLGPIYKAFGEKLWPLMEELNLTLAA
jgi:hypothetical protein